MSEGCRSTGFGRYLVRIIGQEGAELEGKETDEEGMEEQVEEAQDFLEEQEGAQDYLEEQEDQDHNRGQVDQEQDAKQGQG